MDEGWIKLHRKLLSSEIWYKERFSRGQAWVDLILLANHKEVIIIKHDKVIPIKRGQVGHSVLDLSLRWKWSRTKVDSFLIYLQNKNQIQVEKKQRVTTIISITNYDKYQQKNMEKNNEKTTRRQREDINKNVKNDKKKESTAFSEKAGDSKPFYLTKKKKKLTGWKLETFELFWIAFNWPKDKANAADAWLQIPGLTQELSVEKIIPAAKREADNRQAILDRGSTPKWAQGWLSSRRWEDENPSTPKLPYYPAMNKEKPDGTEKYRDVSKLTSGLKEMP